MSEVSDAIQLVMISGRIIAVTGKLGYAALAKSVKILNTIYIAKWKGKTSLKRFHAIKGEDMVFLNVSTEKSDLLKGIERELKHHQILFARLPDLCGGDGRTQYVMSPSDAGKLKPFLLDHMKGKYHDISVGPIRPSDYVGTGLNHDGTPTPELQSLSESAAENMARNRTAPQHVPVQQSPEQAQQLRHYDVTRTETVRIYEKETVLRHENWEMIRMPDGLHGIVIPEGDIIGTGKEGATIFAVDETKNYLIRDLNTGEDLEFNGKTIIHRMDYEEDIYEKNKRMKRALEYRKLSVTGEIPALAQTPEQVMEGRDQR